MKGDAGKKGYNPRLMVSQNDLTDHQAIKLGQTAKNSGLVLTEIAGFKVKVALSNTSKENSFQLFDEILKKNVLQLYWVLDLGQRKNFSEPDQQA